MKKLWVVFTLHEREICAYTAEETFAGELESTIGLLAYENGCSESEIIPKVVMR